MHYFCNKIPVHSKALIVKFHTAEKHTKKISTITKLLKVSINDTGHSGSLASVAPNRYWVNMLNPVSSEIEVFVRSASQGEYGTILEEIIGFSS